MNHSLKHLLAGSALLAAAGATHAEVSGNVAMASDYAFRGISQTNEEFALSGGLDWSSDAGFYVGTWASNVNFGDGQVSTEVDIYAGLGGDVTDTLSYDVGFLWYEYPGDDGLQYDYYELYGSFGFSMGTGGGSLGFAYSPEYYADTGEFWYVSGDYGIGLPGDFGLDFHIGWNVFEDEDEFSAFILPAAGENPGDDYLDWSVTISKSAFGLDFGLAYVDTDLDEEECFAGTELCEPRAIVSVAKSL